MLYFSYRLFFDDTSLEGIGPLRKVVHEVCEAIRFLVDGFIGVGMELSPNKNVCVAYQSLPSPYGAGGLSHALAPSSGAADVGVL